MENMGEWEQKSLVNELKMGKGLARELQIHLNLPSSSREAREALVQRILDSYEKALSLLNLSSSVQLGEPSVTPGVGVVVRMSESPPSLSGSPGSEDSDLAFKDQEMNKDGQIRKRKTMPRWTQKVRVSPGMGLEGSLNDGYSWRKYGQKDILGAKYPRGYYRCTYRNVQGCLATKQIQRSDDDLAIFEITYYGRHTCNQASNSPNNIPPPPGPPHPLQLTPTENQEPNRTLEPNQHPGNQQQRLQPQELLFNFRADLKLITQDLETSQENPFPSFHFPLTTTATTTPMVSSSTLDRNSFMANFSPPLMPPSTSAGTSYLFGDDQNFGNPGGQSSELSEIVNSISTATSTSNSPTVGFGSPYENAADFDPSFTFYNPGAGFH